MNPEAGGAITIRRLSPVDTAAYRTLMLGAYAAEPVAFTATVDEREPLPLEWWATRTSDRPDAAELVYGAFVDDRLVGVVGLRFRQRPRTRHRAHLFGMYVVGELRGQGIGSALVRRVLAHARAAAGIRVVQLDVSAPNESAIRLYESFGFRPFGTEPMANRVGGGFVDKVHMWRPLEQKTG